MVLIFVKLNFKHFLLYKISLGSTSISNGNGSDTPQCHYFVYLSLSIYFHCWSRKWLLTPVLLHGKFYRQRSLAGYSPWGCTELWLTLREQDWILFFYSRCLAHIWWNEGALPWEESLHSLNVLLVLQTGTRSCALQSPLYWCLHCQGKVKVKLQEQDMLSILFHIKPAPPPMFPLKLIQLNLELATDPRSRYTQARQYLMRWPQLKSSAPPRTKWAN